LKASASSVQRVEHSVQVQPPATAAGTAATSTRCAMAALAAVGRLSSQPAQAPSAAFTLLRSRAAALLDQQRGDDRESASGSF